MDEATEKKDFIHEIIREDLKINKNNGKVVTRFPPEPNGYLHIGHAKAICLNFGIADDFNGICNLRFDDTNPSKENEEYVESIKQDIKWLGFGWDERLYFTSDYFGKLYEYAISFIKKEIAYVDSLSMEEIREYRGTLKNPGKDSPYKSRSVEENLEMFEKMKNGDYPEHSHVLRAKIDMASGNMNMRDPVMFRILDTPHYHTGEKWHIYPMYDWAHGQSDSIEGITHSICTLEFEEHRPLYDWFIEQLGIHHPQQIEFARLNLTYTVLSKRKLIELVENNYVSGWDDPRLPTLVGFKRRGYTPESIKNFCHEIGVTKHESHIDISLLEHSLRNDLNKKALRAMAVLDPVKLIITNYPDDLEDEIEAINNPENPDDGIRMVPFSKELFIERDDFMEEPPKKYFRLSPGREVRLRYAYYITCTGFDKDESTGEIREIYCTYDPDTKGGQSPDGRKVKGTIHWVSAKHAVGAELRLYDRLFTVEDPTHAEDKDYKEYLNPDSLQINNNALLEPSLQSATKGVNYQFERKGYFIIDSKDSTDNKLVFNRTVTLRDSWAKQKK